MTKVKSLLAGLFLVALAGTVAAIPPPDPYSTITHSDEEMDEQIWQNYFCVHGSVTLPALPGPNVVGTWRVDLEITGTGTQLPSGYNLIRTPVTPYDPSHGWDGAGTNYWHWDLSVQRFITGTGPGTGWQPASFPAGCYTLRAVTRTWDNSNGANYYYGDEFSITVYP